MGQATDEAGNVWETDAQGNAVRLVRSASGRAGMLTDPYRPAEEARKDEDQAIQQENLRITQAREARMAGNQEEANRIARVKLLADLAKEGKTLDAAGNIIPLEGGRPQLSAEIRAKTTSDYTSLPNLVRGVNNLRKQYDDNLKGANILEGRLGNLRPQDKVFNDESGALSAYVASALGLSGQQFNTPAEQQLFIGSILPNATDTDEQIVSKLDRLDAMVADARVKGRTMLGYSDQNDPLAGNKDVDAFTNRTGGGGAPPPPPAAPSGSTQQSVQMPPEMQSENEAWLRQNLASGDAGAYAQFRQGLDRKYGFNPAPEQDLRQWFAGASAAARQGSNVPLAIPSINQDLSGLDKVRNDVVQNPVGAFAASMGNAGGFGIPSLLAGDQMDALREASPASALLGEIVGGVTGTLGAGAGFQGVSRIPGLSDDAARLLTNPIAADVGYGATYGATQAEDPLYGAMGGAGAAFLGNKAGGFIGSKLGFSPDDPLSGGQRAVVNAANKTGIDPVVDALTRASDLGVPASLADVSPDINTLTGAAIRRSPTVSGMAQDTLIPRGRGQYDRFLGAVERDLGPIENIPARSDALIKQAREQAGPLYESAYAAPGASVLDIEDIATKPSFRPALAEAARQAAEDGVDPNVIGITFDEAGNAIMSQSPSWQTLDYVKRGLDAMIEKETDAVTGRMSNYGRLVTNTKNDLLSRMDTMNPDYAAARAAYAGPASETQALDQGRKAVAMSPMSLEHIASGVSPTKAQQMRLGFQSQLAENAGRPSLGSNPFEATLGNPNMERKLAAIYPEGTGDVATLLAQRDLERQLAGSSNRLIGNSMTAERQIADQAFDEGGLGSMAVDVGVNALSGGLPVTSAIKALGGNYLKDAWRLGVGKKATQKAEEIGPIALNTDPQAAIAELLAMQQQSLDFQNVLDALAQIRGVRGGHVGAGAVSPVAAALMRE